ncbi:MAG: hypothetical protein LH472_06855 [Pyrinomonadaceae bacterium]|nr:hypothetical protein [Pyrinomonadaceae bacterium]
MKSRHITKILDRTEFSRISAADSVEIAEHINDCQNCRAAFQAARISSILLKENSLAESLAPSPFFQMKVLNAWREKQIVQKPLAAFWRWWQASATLVLLMCLTVIGLMAITFAASNSETAANQKSSADGKLFSAETVILNQKPPHNLTTEQVFEVLDAGK